MKEGVTHNSRKEGNFIKGMNPDKRDRYIKRWISSINPEELIPYIKITGHDSNFREIKYVIDIPLPKEE